MARRATVIDGNAPLPEADRVMDFAHPRETVRFFGHEMAESALAAAIDSGRMHHGWLFAGPSGIGKATLAYRCAKYILSPHDDRDATSGPLGLKADSSADRLIRAQSHPGLLVIRRPYDAKAKRFATTIPVDEVRRVRNFLTHSGGDDAWRVVIVDTADEMNANAANALLKSLEEPPERTVFFLISSEPGGLLATIRSRCRLLQMAPLDPPDLAAACSDAFDAADVARPEDDAWSQLVSLGRGRVGRVLSLFVMGGVDAQKDADRFLAGAERPDWRTIHAFGEKLAPAAAAERFDLFFELLLERLSKLVRTRAGASGDDKDHALGARLIASEQIPRWAALWEEIARGKAEVAALNLDRKAFIIDTAQRLHELSAQGGDGKVR